MAKGENIFKRRDGRWEARYIKGRELSGKIRYGFCYGRTYKEAKEKVTQRKAAVLNGSPAPETGSRHRLAFYCWPSPTPPSSMRPLPGSCWRRGCPPKPSATSWQCSTGC